jgi:hypothetical protein
MTEREQDETYAAYDARLQAEEDAAYAAQQPQAAEDKFRWWQTFSACLVAIFLYHFLTHLDRIFSSWNW